MGKTHPRILTNMTFWQSSLWRERTDSIYPLKPTGGDPEFLPPWREVWRLFRGRRHYDVILTMGIRESMAYGLLCALLGVEPKQIMTEVFIDQPQPGRLLWRLKTRLYRWVARRAIGIITNSSEEVHSNATRFGMSEERLRFVPLNATIRPENPPESEPPFILSAGRTLRDYELIVRAARKIAHPIVVICGPGDLQNMAIPDHVTVLRDLDRSVYLDHLRRCAVVALPLLQTERSTGQVVMLEAMAMGKPVITTRSPGTIDYVRNEENGFLIDYGDSALLIQRCRELLDAPAMRRRIGAEAREDVRRHYAPDDHAAAKLEAIRAMAGQKK